jgi:hypothetical protein
MVFPFIWARFHVCDGVYGKLFPGFINASNFWFKREFVSGNTDMSKKKKALYIPSVFSLGPGHVKKEKKLYTDKNTLYRQYIFLEEKKRKKHGKHKNGKR